MNFKFNILLSSLFFLISVTLADLHDSCTCHNGDSYNFRMTIVACTLYDDAKYQWGGVVYDTPSGRCTQRTASDQIGGNEWEAGCKSIAKSGFQCADGQGTCFANPDDVTGQC